MGTVQLRAPMQGTIVSVDVVVGQQVRTGQQVMLIESMKMHHAIEADASGAIKLADSKDSASAWKAMWEETK
jgi:biotin carboxyl carrier protein